MGQALANPRLISLAAGFVDTMTLPHEATQQAFAALEADPAAMRQALQYGTTLGCAALRADIRDRLLTEDRLPADCVDTDQFVLTAGSNQLLQLVGEALLDPGDIVLCAAPTYFVFLGMLQNFGARAIGVAVDEQGMQPAALRDTLSQLTAQGLLRRVKAIYLVSYCDNPRGVTLPSQRRQEIADISKGVRSDPPIYLIDDLAYRPLDLTPSPPPSLLAFDAAAERTIVAGTFSKSFSPGLRVGWGLLPKTLLPIVANLKGNIDFGSPHLNQHLMHRALRLGLFDAQVERLRVTYRIKRDVTLQALTRSLGHLPGVRWLTPSGGLYVWLELPTQIAAGGDSRLFQRAVQRGVLYVPGEVCYPDEGVPRQQNTIRLSFGVPSPQIIEEGIMLLGQALTDVMSDVV